MTTLFVPGVPAPQGSKGHVGGGRLVESSKKVGPWRAAVRAEVVRQRLAPLIGPVEVVAIYYFPRPSSHLKKDGTLRASAPRWAVSRALGDIEKLDRSTRDALTAVDGIGAYLDDSQIVRGSHEKCYAQPGQRAGALITYRPLFLEPS